MGVEIFSGRYRLKLNRCDSKRELRETLMRCQGGFFMLTEPVHHTCYYILRYRLYSQNEWVGVGINLETCVFPPAIVVNGEDTCLLIGYNNRVALISLSQKKVLFDHELDGYMVFLKYHQGDIIAISELNLLYMSSDGQIISNYAFDGMLESFEIHEHYVLCETDGGLREYQLKKNWD